MRRTSAFAASLLILLVSAGARAEQAVLALGVSPEYSVLRPDGAAHGTGAGLHAEYGVDEYLNLRFVAGYDRYWADNDEALHSVRFGLGATYGLDNTEVVPFLSVGIGGFVSIDEQVDYDLDFGGAFGLGFDWLILDSFSLGLEATYHALFTDIERVMATLGIRINWRIDVM